MTNTQTKLKVTAEQKAALDMYTSYKYGSSLEEYVKYKDCWSNDYLPLTELSIDEMAKAIYVGYELKEDELKIGDWVTPKQAGKFLSIHKEITVAQVTEVDFRYEIGNCEGYFTRDYLRLATPNEIFWAKLGRKTDELRLGDVVVAGKSSLYRIVETKDFADQVTLSRAMQRLEDGELSRIYPGERELTIPKKE